MNNRQQRRTRAELLRPLLGPVLLLFAAGCDRPLSEQAAFGTLERDRIELAADSNEPIETVLVQEGQQVAPDEPLLRQNTRRAEAALARARAEEAAALAALAEAEAGPRAQDIAQGRARLEAARSSRQTVRHELDRLLSLVERKYASRSELDVMQGRYDEAVAREAEARAALDELLEGTRGEAIDQARNRFVAASATVQDLELTLERATVRSPVAGTVDALPYEIGERPPPGETVAVVLDRSRLYARIHVPADVRNRLLSGARAEIRVDGYPDPFPGTLRWVASDAAFTPYYALSQHDRTRLSYVAEVDVSGKDDDRLPVGVPVQVTFPDLSP